MRPAVDEVNNEKRDYADTTNGFMSVRKQTRLLFVCRTGPLEETRRGQKAPPFCVFAVDQAYVRLI